MTTVANTENVLKVLFDYNKWWNTGAVPAEYLRDYKRSIYSDVFQGLNDMAFRRIVILNGARRTGKSTIMYQIIDTLLEKVDPKSIILVSFDHPLLKLLTIEDILEIYKNSIADSGEVYLFLDEIQYSKDWSQHLKIIYDLSPKVHVIATGSVSSAIVKESKESGLGRFLIIPVPTLSFSEYLKIKKVDVPEIDLKNVDPFKLYELPLQRQTDIMMKLDKLQLEFLNYIQIGGFPENILSDNITKANRLLREDVIDKAIKKDIPEVFDIRNTLDLERIFLYLCYNSGSLINIEAIAKELNGISRITIEKYISYLESANLIYICKPTDIRGKGVLKLQNKIYIADSSIRNSVLLNNVLTDPEELGILVEGVVYRHIKYHFQKDMLGVGYFKTDSKGKEIDIVVMHNQKVKLLAEVKYREQAEIKETDAIVTYALAAPNLVITKRGLDFGLKNHENGKKIYRIPAHVLLYLLG